MHRKMDDEFKLAFLCHVITSYGYSAKNLGRMFRLQQIIQAVFGNFTDRTKDDVSFSDYLAKYDVIRATNECCEEDKQSKWTVKPRKLLSFSQKFNDSCLLEEETLAQS